MESDIQKRVFIWGYSAYQGFRLQGRSRNWLEDLWTSDGRYQMLEGNRPYVDFGVPPDLSYHLNWGYQEWFWVNENKSNGMGDSRAWEARTSIRCLGRKVLVILQEDYSQILRVPKPISKGPQWYLKYDFLHGLALALVPAHLSMAWLCFLMTSAYLILLWAFMRDQPVSLFLWLKYSLAITALLARCSGK